MPNTMDTLKRGNLDSRNGFGFNGCSISSSADINHGDQLSTADTTRQGGNVIPVEIDYFDGVLEYIKQMLMEEDDLNDRPCMFQDSLALQAAEKAFFDALTADETPPLNGIPSSSIDQNLKIQSCLVPVTRDNQRGEFGAVDLTVDSPMNTFQVTGSSSSRRNQSGTRFRGQKQEEAHRIGNEVHPSCTLELENFNPYGEAEEYKNKENDPSNGLMGKRNHCHEDGASVEEGRNSKQFAAYNEEPEEMEKYDNALLCPIMNPGFYDEQPPQCGESSETGGGNKSKYGGSKRGRPRAGERPVNIREVVDLGRLLIQCAEAMARYDSSTAYQQLRRIRQHSTPYGDANERLAQCFANALEARLAGTGTEIYSALNTRRISTAAMLKAYQIYVTASPFKRMSNIFSNKSIGKLTKGASTIHIIDFGILYGFQWPCFIQGISLRPGGPPKLRITGIDIPQPGFRPAERVEETGCHLGNYCKRFSVPFEYNAIAKNWDSICLEDLKINTNEVLVVNCMYRLKHVPDETLMENSPRDNVLNLIKKINPDVFIHGIVNGRFNGPLFLTRFREAFFHFSSLFDMFDATLPREDPERLLLEKAILGRDAMNAVACEGTQRIERPETYKQWQVRNRRAGFRQLPLNQDITREIRTKVKLRYHKDFLVDEDSNWMLQGWKGRVIYALSCWKPVDD